MRRRLPSLTALKAFEAAARLTSFKQAASELHVTATAVSRQIKRLEAELGFRLFDRGNRSVALTDKGRRYADAVRRAFDDISASTAELAVESRESDRLTLLVERQFATRWLMPRLPQFNRQWMDIDVEIIPVTELTELPVDGAHAAIIYGTLDQPGVRQDCLLNLYAFPVCSPRLARGSHELRTPADLGHCRLLHEVSVVWWKKWLTMAGVTSVDWSGGHIFHENSLALEAALAGEGVAMGDNLLALKELESGELIKPFEQTCPSGSYYLATRESPVADRPLDAFRQWLLESCAAQQLECDKWR